MSRSRYGSMLRLIALFTCCVVVTPASGDACGGPREVHEASLESIKTFIRGKQKAVLTFTGYSGAEYQDPRGDDGAGCTCPGRTIAFGNIDQYRCHGTRHRAQSMKSQNKKVSQKWVSSPCLLVMRAFHSRIALTMYFMSKTAPGEGGFQERIVSHQPRKRWLKAVRPSSPSVAGW